MRRHVRVDHTPVGCRTKGRGAAERHTPYCFSGGGHMRILVYRWSATDEAWGITRPHALLHQPPTLLPEALGDLVCRSSSACCRATSRLFLRDQRVPPQIGAQERAGEGRLPLRLGVGWTSTSAAMGRRVDSLSSARTGLTASAHTCNPTAPDRVPRPAPALSGPHR